VASAAGPSSISWEVFVVQYMTIDKQSDAELVATVLGRKSTDVAVTRLATAISIEGSVGFPLEEVVREYGTVGPRRHCEDRGCG